MFTSVAIHSYSSTGSISPPGVILSITDSTDTSSTSSAWQPPEETPPDVLEAMEDPNIISAVTDPVGHRDYMSLIIFQKTDNLFPADEYNQLKAKKIEMVGQQKIIEGRSRFNSPTCLKVRLVAILAFGILFVVLFSLPESIFSHDSQASLPVLSSGKGLSLGGTIIGMARTHRQAARQAEARKKLENIKTEISEILKEKKAWFEARAYQCIIDHVERTPCYDDPKMLNQLMAKSAAFVRERIDAAAKNLLMQKIIDNHWETSHEFLKLKLLEIMPDERMANRILRPLVDAVLLVKLENSTHPANRGSTGLRELRERANGLAGNTMVNVLNLARRIQNEAFERRLNPPGTNIYLAPYERKNTVPHTTQRTRRDTPASSAKQSPLSDESKNAGTLDNTASTTNNSLSSSRASTSPTPSKKANASITPLNRTSTSTIPSKKASTSTTSSANSTPSKIAGASTTPLNRASTSTIPSKKS